MDIYRQVDKRSGASGWRRKWSGKEERVERGRVGNFREEERSGERGAGGVGKFGVGERRESGDGGVGNFFYIGRGGKYTIQYTATNQLYSHKPNIQPQITLYSIKRTGRTNKNYSKI